MNYNQINLSKIENNKLKKSETISSSTREKQLMGCVNHIRLEIKLWNDDNFFLSFSKQRSTFLATAELDSHKLLNNNMFSASVDSAQYCVFFLIIKFFNAKLQTSF